MHRRLQRRKLIRKLNALSCASDSTKSEVVAENVEKKVETIKTEVGSQLSSEVESPEACSSQPSSDRDKEDSDVVSNFFITVAVFVLFLPVVLPHALCLVFCSH